MSGLIPQAFIENLLHRVDIGELIGSRITLKKVGNHYTARCPFHEERTPSFNVMPDKGFYHCFGCGASGDAISFLRDFDQLDFTQAVEELAKRAGLDVPYDEQAKKQIQQARSLTDALAFAASAYQQALLQHPHSHTARNYLQQRGLSDEIIQRYQIGYAPGQQDFLASSAAPDLLDGLIKTHTVSDRFAKPMDLFRNRIMFPIRDTRGRTLAFGGRTLVDDKAKYINSPESEIFHKSHEIYGLFEARQANRQLTQLLVVEGYMDVVALAQFGITEAVATLGTATNADNISALLKQTHQLIFCFDGDNAGYRAADRAMENALPLLADGITLKFMMLPQGEDPDTLVRKIGAQAFRKLMEAAAPLSRFLFDRKSQDLDLDIPENASEFRVRCEPLMKLVPGSTIRSLLWDEFFKRIKRDKAPFASKGFAFKGFNKGGGAQKIPPAELTVAARQVRLSSDINLCLALLINPRLTQELLNLPDAQNKQPHAFALASWLHRQPEARDNSARLLASLMQDDAQSARLKSLFNEIQDLPPKDAILEDAAALFSSDDQLDMRKKAELLRFSAHLSKKATNPKTTDAT